LCALLHLISTTFKSSYVLVIVVFVDVITGKFIFKKVLFLLYTLVITLNIKKIKTRTHTQTHTHTQKRI
jgi:hypothetical protein